MSVGSASFSMVNEKKDTNEFVVESKSYLGFICILLCGGELFEFELSFVSSKELGIVVQFLRPVKIISQESGSLVFCLVSLF